MATLCAGHKRAENVLGHHTPPFSFSFFSLLSRASDVTRLSDDVPMLRHRRVYIYVGRTVPSRTMRAALFTQHTKSVMFFCGLEKGGGRKRRRCAMRVGGPFAFLSLVPRETPTARGCVSTGKKIYIFGGLAEVEKNVNEAE